MAQRITPTRLVETRAVPTRAVVGRRNGRVSTVSTPTQRARQQREREQIISNIKTSVKSFIGSISNINELDNKIQSYYNANVQNVPLDLQGDFKSYIQQERNSLIKSQNDLKARLENSIKVYTQREEYYSSIDRYAVADKYYAQLKKAKSLLSSLNSGNVLNATDSYSAITSVGRQAQKEKYYRMATSQSAINKYISEGVNYKLESVKQISKRFDISLSKAKEIRKEIQDKQTKEIFGEIKIKKTGSSLEEIKKTRNQVKKFAKNITDNYYIKYINTNASFPPSIQNARSIFLNELTNRQISDFNQLNKEAKRIIINYALLKNLKATVFNNIASNKELVQIFTSDDVLQSKSKIYKIFNKRILNLDIKNINELIKLKDNSLLKLASNNIVNKLNNYIKSINNFIEKKEIIEINNLSNLKKLIIEAKNKTISKKEVEKKISNVLKNYPKGFEVINEIKKKGFFKSFLDEIKRNLNLFKSTTRPDRLVRYSALNSILIVLENKENLSTEDFIFWKNSLNDLTGVKEFSKKEINKLKKDFGTKKYKVIIDRLLRIKDILVVGGKIALNDLLNIFVNTSTIMDLYNKKKTLKDLNIDNITNGFVKFGINIGRKLNDDSFEIGYRLSSKLTNTQRNNVKLNTVSAIKKIYKTGISINEFAKKLKNHPELITLGLATGVFSLIKFNKTKLKNNPDRYFSEIASFFIDNYILRGTIKGFKITKRLFSPFVLRNIKVFEKGATKITTAKALKLIEGKKIDLFSASPNKIKELFKGADIGKSDLNKLIKDMLNNPNMYIGNNKKIKKLDSIVKTKAQRDILDFAKENNAILTGSASLKLQLKDFRKVGDFDLIVNNPKLFGNKLKDYLNKNTLLGRISKYERYTLKQNKKVKEVYYIVDKLTGKKIVDLDDLDLISKNLKYNIGRGLSKSDLIKVNGINILKVETQLPLKTSLVFKTSSSLRAEKELKDVALIVKRNKNKLSNSKFNSLKKILDNNDNVLRVKGNIEGLGKDRKWFWVEKYGINPKLKEKTIISKLKKYGLSTAMINKNIDLYSSDGFYFGIDKVYSYFLKGKKGTIVYVKNFKIDRYPKDIQRLLKKNLKGLLGSKEKLKLRKMLNRYIKNNPDKVLLGEKPLVDLIGEEEAISSVFTRLYPKKKLITREVYIPILDDFVKVQEAVIGKRPLSKIKGLYKKFSTKMKKGYKVSDMKKDILNWAKRNLDDFKAEVKKIAVSKKERLDFVKNQRKLLDEEIEAINKIDLPQSEKNKIIRSLRRNTRNLIQDQTKSVSKLLERARELYKLSRRRVVRVLKARKIKVPNRFVRIRDIDRVKIRIRPRVKKVVRKKIVKRIERPTKRVVTRKVAPRVRKIVPFRNIERFVSRGRIITPNIIKRIERVEGIKLPKLNFDWDDEIPRGYKRIVDGFVLIRNKPIRVVSNLPENKAWNKVFVKGTKKYRGVDKSTPQSFEFIIVGIKKTKDDKVKLGLKKTRPKKTKGSKVLKVVEKRKYAIDSKGEKAGLSLAKKVSKKRVVKKNVVKKKTQKTNKTNKKKTSTKRKTSVAVKKRKATKKANKTQAKRKKTNSNRKTTKRKGK